MPSSFVDTPAFWFCVTLVVPLVGGIAGAVQIWRGGGARFVIAAWIQCGLLTLLWLSVFYPSQNNSRARESASGRGARAATPVAICLTVIPLLFATLVAPKRVDPPGFDVLTK